ncbi:MAG TPA: GNAT family N-acetyltransferase [Patescibacteria group bacterium]|nr:GNAT family N-acetyltransferase [Patescibacteria group bacterium]
MRDTSPLDNPIWHALNEAHRPLARAAGLAARYPADVSPFAGLQEYTQAAFDDLAALVEPGQTIALFTRQPVAVPDGWAIERAVTIGQMLCHDLQPQEGPHPLRLTDDDVPEMLDLVKRTEPGPFLPRTNRMGSYYGYRDNGRLVAMTGMRLGLAGFAEISAVCTDPDFRGQGLAGMLSTYVAREIISGGRHPFLHYRLDNPARHLYEKLGFQPNGTIELTICTR